MKKQLNFPGIRLLIADVPASVIGVSERTMLRRKQAPGTLTLDELKRVIDYKAIQGIVPIETSRRLVREDLKLQ